MAAPAGRRDPAGARRRLDRGPLGLQRRAAGAHHRRRARCRWSAASATKPTSPSPISAPTCARRRRPPRPSWSPRRASCGWARSTLLGRAAARRAVPRRARRASQRLDVAAGRLGRPSALVARQQLRLAHRAQRLHYAVLSQDCSGSRRRSTATAGGSAAADRRVRWRSAASGSNAPRCGCSCSIRALVLQRGYAGCTNERRAGRHQRAPDWRPAMRCGPRLADGAVDLTVNRKGTTGKRPTRAT